MTRRTLEIIAFVSALLLAALAFHAWLAAHDEQQRLQSTLATQKQLIDAASARERSRDATLASTLAQIDKLKRANQTPQQIVSDLQKYLSLPQPITLQSRAPSAGAPQPSLRALGVQPNRQENEQGTGFPPSGLSDGSPNPTRSLHGFPDAPTIRSPAQPFGDSLCVAPSGCPPGMPSRPNLEPSPPSSIEPVPGPALLNRSPSHSPCTGASDCSAEVPASDLKPLYNYVQDCRSCQAQLAVARQNASDDASQIAALTRERDAAITASKGGTFWRRLRRNMLWLSVGAALGYAAASR